MNSESTFRRDIQTSQGESAPRCPTCRAPWRGVSPCSRCGTDISDWGQVLTAAKQRRESSRLLFLEGAYPEACREALHAWRLQHTEYGRRLLILCLLATGQGVAARRLMG